MKKKVFTALGLMTGTSVDGVDLSLIKSDGFSYFTSIFNKYYKLDADLREGIIELRDKISSVKDLVSSVIYVDITVATIVARILLFFKNCINS